MQNLTEVLDPDRVLEHVDEKTVAELAEHLPNTGLSPREELEATLRSPQFQQTTSRLTSILNGQHFGELMGSLGLSASGGIGVDAFLDAIQETVDEDKDDNDNDTQGDTNMPDAQS